MNRKDIIEEFWSTVGMFWHPNLRLALARSIYGDINKPIKSFEPDLGPRMVAIMNDLLTMEDVTRLIQAHAVLLKQNMMIEDERLAMTGSDLFSSVSSTELSRGAELLLYLFERQFPELPSPSQYEKDQLRLG